MAPQDHTQNSLLKTTPAGDSSGSGPESGHVLDPNKGALAQDCPRPPLPQTKPKPSIAAIYQYCDENGVLQFETVRYEPKDFRQRRLGPEAKPIWNLKGVRLVPYRLPELIAAVKAGQTIFIAEGEKDVETLRSWGLAATCNPMGAGKWGKVADVAAEVLRGANVVVVPDDDETGRKHAKDVAAHLAEIAASVKVLPNFPGAKDVTGWVEAGGTREALEAMVSAGETDQVHEHPWAAQRTTFAEMLARRPEPPRWLVDGVLEEESIVIVYGLAGSLKSMLIADLALCAAAGKAWLEPMPREDVPSRPTTQCGVLWCDLDNGARKTHTRFRALALAHNITAKIPITFFSFPDLDLSKPDSVVALRDAIVAEQAGLVVIDTLINATSIQNENDNAQLRTPMFAMRTLCEQTGACIIAIHHPAKGSKPGATHEDLRGGGAIAAAADLTLRVVREKPTAGDITITATKTRGAEVWPMSAEWICQKDTLGTLISGKFHGKRLVTKQQKAGGELEDAILRELSPDRLGRSNKEDLKEAVGPKRSQDLVDALRRLEDDGRIKVTWEKLFNDKGSHARRKVYELVERKKFTKFLPD